MIRLQSSGRLGNRLFQWAYAHQLASRFNTCVKLTHDSINYDSVDTVSSVPSCCPSIVTGKSEIVGLVTAFTDKFKFNPNIFGTDVVFSQNNPYLNPVFERIPLIVRGYFTSSNTIVGYEEHLSNALNDWISRNVKPDSISDSFLANHLDYQVMHVRRGDFLQHKETLGLLSIDYYKQARNLDKPLAIVTDAPNELPEFLSSLHPQIMLHSGNSTIFDSLNLLRNGSSVVLSNSTFSWWGGFLASRRKARVLLPSPFFKSDALVGEAFTSEYFQSLSSKFD